MINYNDNLFGVWSCNRWSAIGTSGVVIKNGKEVGLWDSERPYIDTMLKLKRYIKKKDELIKLKPKPHKLDKYL